MQTVFEVIKISIIIYFVPFLCVVAIVEIIFIAVAILGVIMYLGDLGLGLVRAPRPRDHVLCRNLHCRAGWVRWLPSC